MARMKQNKLHSIGTHHAFPQAILSMGFNANAKPRVAHSRLWSPQTGRHRWPVWNRFV